MTAPLKIQPPSGNYILPRKILYVSIIIILTFIAFFPSLKNDFVNIDDDTYVINNPDIQGFTLHNLAKIFSSKYVDNYQPVTMLTYMAEYSLFKSNPGIFHFTNLLLHIINGILVLTLISALSGSFLTGVIAGLLFAVHPLRVESVAWIAERKDVLSAFFFFFSLLFYVHYRKKTKQKSYWFSMFSLILSLLSKPMAVSQPFVLLLIDYLAGVKIDRKSLLEKVPFFIISLVFAAVTLFTQNVTGSVSELQQISVLQRICIPFYGMVFYLAKSIVPVDLCSFYPFSSVLDSGRALMLFASPFLVIGITAVVFYFRSYSRKLVFGTLFFVITVLPMLQIVPVGNAIVADRYTYVPMVGIYFIFAALIGFLLKEKIKTSKIAKVLLLSVVAIPLIIFIYLTNDRCGAWKNSITLWDDAVNKYPAAKAFLGRGMAYSEKGDYDHAVEDFNHAISLHPPDALASVTYNNRGIACINRGLYNRAIEDFNKAIALNSRYFDAYYNRANAYYYSDDYDRAIKDYTQTIRLKPSYSYAYCNRGAAYCGKGDYDRGIEDFNKALRFNPNDEKSYYCRGLAYKEKGDNYNSLYDFKKACNMGFDLACKQLSDN